MQKQGYYRWLIAYLPIFFIIISTLILIFFFAMSGYSQRQTVLANEVFAQHALQAVDLSLGFTEQIIVKELITDEKLRLFFDVNQQPTAFQLFEISQRINHLIIAFPPIQSIYLYRASDQMVLSPNTMMALDQFGDRDFVGQMLDRRPPYAWTDSRIYQEFAGEKYRMNVISLVKQVPLGSGSRGLLVVNVLSRAIDDMFSHLLESNVYVNLRDTQNHVLFGEVQPTNVQLSEIQSAYTGWTITSGLKNKTSFSLLSVFSDIWILLGIMTVVIGTVWMVYSVRRNYRPIEAIRNRIQLYASQKNNLLGNKHAGDEFHFIHSSIESIIETLHNHEQTYQENLAFRKKWFFDELINGDRRIDAEVWQTEMKYMGFSDHPEHVAVVILEIDKYADFCIGYSHGDQQLLKFVITRVVKEISQHQGIDTWNEWIGNHQVGMLCAVSQDNEASRSTVRQFCEAVRNWIEDNLRFTVSLGIGHIVHSIPDASRSYHSALEALQYKPAFGANKTIAHWEIDTLPQGQIYRYLPEIRSMAQYYRLGQEEWKPCLRQLFSRLKAALAPRDEIISAMSYMVFTIQQEMAALPEEMSQSFEQDALDKLNRLLHQFDTLEQIEPGFLQILNDAAGKLSVLRERRDNHQLIRQVREYIDAHFANPDLSLAHLSDEFHLSFKNLSRIFKEEFGENFVDYLAKVRIERAKQFMMDMPDESIQEIARNVGYTHSISFIRMFKKMEGVTPGQYRKHFG